MNKTISKSLYKIDIIAIVIFENIVIIMIVKLKRSQDFPQRKKTEKRQRN